MSLSHLSFQTHLEKIFENMTMKNQGNLRVVIKGLCGHHHCGTHNATVRFALSQCLRPLLIGRSALSYTLHSFHPIAPFEVPQLRMFHNATWYFKFRFEDCIFGLFCNIAAEYLSIILYVHWASFAISQQNI